MIVQYNKIASEHRSLVRSIHSKGYSAYIRYLLMKRWPFERVRQELVRLGLSWNEKQDYEIYFKEVLYPVIKRYNLNQYYKKYQYGLMDEPLTYKTTFRNSEKERALFVDILYEMEIEPFFAEEITNYYGGPQQIPNHPRTGKPLIAKDKPVDLVGILQHPQRHVIESLLLDGYSHKQISSFLFQRYDAVLDADEIKVYARTFFNYQRADISRLIETLQEEKRFLDEQMFQIKKLPPEEFTPGERFEKLAILNSKVTELSNNIKRLSQVHTNSTFNAAVLEASNLREMFADVTIRAHRRFREMDDRTEDAVIAPLNSLVSMMKTATDKVIQMDAILSQESSKSIQEEILDTVMPNLDRIAEENREAMYAYKKVYEEVDEDEDDDDQILGYE